MHTLLKYFSLFSLVWDVQIRRLQNHYGVVFSVLQQKETLNGSKQKFHPYFLFHSWERNIYFLTKIKNEERFLSNNICKKFEMLCVHFGEIHILLELLFFSTLTQKLKTSQKNYQYKHSIQFKLFEYSFEKYNSYV